MAQPKPVINYLHYNRTNNTIVEPVLLPGTPSTEFQFGPIPVQVTNSANSQLLGMTNLRWTIYHNIYHIFIDELTIPDTGDLQDIFFVQFPFNLPNPNPFPNIPNTAITVGDITFVLNGDYRAGTISLLNGEGGWIMLIWPDKLLNGGGITANAAVTFGPGLFSVAFSV